MSPAPPNSTEICNRLQRITLLKLRLLLTDNDVHSFRKPLHEESSIKEMHTRVVRTPSGRGTQDGMYRGKGREREAQHHISAKMKKQLF